ncbi:Peroxisomal biogenesis factor 6 [Leucoagaricus sp. SymC.cos]|nr:Peroxisomal biogenesis factor 6 [Leucoagaricus sp. SymC.cos]
MERVSVGSLADWLRVKNNYNSSALDAIISAIDAEGYGAERDAILANFSHFMESTFSMAQANLRVNGHSFDSIDAAGQDVEAFDEALDRRIWSLADTRLQWHKRMAKTRREVPTEIQTRVSTLFTKVQAQDETISQPDDAMDEDEEPVEGMLNYWCFLIFGRVNPQAGLTPVAPEVAEEFHMTSAITQELDQVRIALMNCSVISDSESFFSPSRSPSSMSLLSARRTALRTSSAILTQVILDALSDTAYRFALDNPEQLKQLFTIPETHLQLGSIHEIPSTSSQDAHQYRTLMLEPVSRGHVHPKTTQIIVVHSENPRSLVSANFLAESTDSDSIEIDESFLENALAPNALKLSERTGNDHSSTSSRDGEHTPYVLFDIESLVTPVSSLEDHCTLYIRTSDLGRVGLLNEDWGVANSDHEYSYRLVRIVANDRLVRHPGTVCGSPILLSNILGSSEWNNEIGVPRISLRPSPFGQRQPAIPTAKSVTVARIASPFSINRKYQTASLNALKAYFAATKRLVKANDIIAFSLYAKSDSPGRADDGGDEDEDGRAGNVNEVVYFLITNVEHSVIPNQVLDGGQDLYTGSTVGELGCWIDSSVTRMVQTGLEHARVPEIGSYLEPDTQHNRAIFSFLKRLPFSHLLSPKAPFSKLLALVSAGFSPQSVNYNLQLSILLKGMRGIGKFSTVCGVAQQLGMHVLEVDCFNLIGENDTKTEATLQVRFEQAGTCSPCILALRNIEALAQTTQPLGAGKEPAIVNALKEYIRESAQSWKITGFPVVVLATSNDTSRVPTSILSCFKHEVEFEHHLTTVELAPSEEERLEILLALLSKSTLAPDVSLRGLAIQTAALVAIDLSDLVFRARSSAFERAGEDGMHDVLISARDFDNALKRVRAAYSENIGAPKIPNVTWDDVGGLAHVKADILDTIQLPLEHPELFADGLKKRSGILLYGPPGTGKTLVAKAVATSCSLNFFSVKGPELLNMYIGESEANVRRVFQRARDAKPCVIFFDELDSVAPKRGNHGDSGGVMDRIVSQLLAEIDGMSSGDSSADVFVIGATNRPDLLDPALLRPGRFDRMLYLGVSETHGAQLKILEALTRKFKLHPDLDLKDIAERCPFNYTGADFYALCSDAMLNAMSRTAQRIEDKLANLNLNPGDQAHPYPLTPQYYLAEMASPDEIRVEVYKEDFLQAVRNLVPSISQAEMEHYARVQERFSQDVHNDEDTLQR